MTTLFCGATGSWVALHYSVVAKASSVQGRSSCRTKHLELMKVCQSRFRRTFSAWNHTIPGISQGILVSPCCFRCDVSSQN